MSNPNKDLLELLKELSNSIKNDVKAQVKAAVSNSGSITSEAFRGIFNSVIAKPEHKNRIEELNNALRQFNVPRADDLQLNNRDVVRVTPNVENRLKTPDWAKVFDGLPVPPQITDTNRKQLLSSFDNAMNKATNEFKNTLKMANRPKFTPAPGKSHKPRPEGF